ncbi:MAG TPA: SnoaL-like domain-containing protein [Cyclobacteriaceae bacterium]|nr:SnoaL-like domain-containing protein [Cyclobacteriaceae bacterium]
MTTKQVATRLVELCRQGKIMEAQKELYGESIVSIEPEKAPVRSAKGLKAVTEKGVQFAAMIEQHHGGNISDPIVYGNHFSIGWAMDVTMKGAGRMNMEEICVYEVNDGKIVHEQFYF